MTDCIWGASTSGEELIPVLISAASLKALQCWAEALGDYCHTHSDLKVNKFAYQLLQLRSALLWKGVIFAANKEELLSRLELIKDNPVVQDDFVNCIEQPCLGTNPPVQSFSEFIETLGKVIRITGNSLFAGCSLVVSLTLNGFIKKMYYPAGLVQSFLFIPFSIRISLLTTLFQPTRIPGS